MAVQAFACNTVAVQHLEWSSACCNKNGHHRVATRMVIIVLQQATVAVQVNYGDNAEAKSMGARFDGNVKCWYGDTPDSIAALGQRFARR